MWRTEQKKPTNAFICFMSKSLLNRQVRFSERFSVSTRSLREGHMTWQLECRWLQMSGIVLKPCHKNLFFTKNRNLIRQLTEFWTHLVSNPTVLVKPQKNPELFLLLLLLNMCFHTLPFLNIETLAEAKGAVKFHDLICCPACFWTNEAQEMKSHVVWSGLATRPTKSFVQVEES